jgi:hypothetical protein
VSGRAPGVVPPPWDNSQNYTRAASKIIRALHRGTGCHLTAEEVAALDFAEGDGDWWQEAKCRLLELANATPSLNAEIAGP